MQTMGRFVACSFLILSCSRHSSASKVSALYDADDRHDVTDSAVPRIFRERVSATFTLLERSKLAFQEGRFVVKQEHRRTLLEKSNLCADAPFAHEPAVTTCSGFLAASEVAVTAGHCFKHVSDCDRWAFVFGYSNARAESLYEFSPEEVRFCPENWRQRRADVALEGPEGLRDYAVVKLDRPVAGVSPLPMRRAGRIGAGAPLVMMGHPSGVPVKITLGGISISAATSLSFGARIDAFHGNSGSPVLHAETGEVEGILVRGADPDYARDPAGCLRPRVIPESDFEGPGNRETISSVESFRDFVDAMSGATPR